MRGGFLFLATIHYLTKKITSLPLIPFHTKKHYDKNHIISILLFFGTNIDKLK